jgi:RNA exonuclease 1
VLLEEQVDKLHASLPFVKVPPSPSSSRPETILALDCEMGYTTLGMELIRLTVINANHEKILDELVLPSHMVIDLNTRYSGITTLAGVKHNLVSIRQALFDLMDPTTILLGHGLENDLKALRVTITCMKRWR